MARNTPADEAGGVGIALQLGETVEILDARRAQQQAFGFDADVVGVHAGFRFTRVVICPLQERRAPRAFVLVGVSPESSRLKPLLPGQSSRLRRRCCRSARARPPARSEEQTS